MTAFALAALIHGFCDVHKLSDLDDFNKAVCVDFMNNCAVAQAGLIEKKSVDKCEKTWLYKGGADFVKRSYE